MEPRLIDMHCHLDAFDRAPEVAASLRELGVGVLSVTVSPLGFKETRALGAEPCIWHAAGLHPWGFADDADPEPAVESLLGLVGQTRYIGEVGLDYLEKHVPKSAWAAERAAFERIASACAQASDPARPHLLSIHSVQAAKDVLDILESTGAAERCQCIFHWFGGSTDELWRAIGLGCWFSCNPMMMGIKRSKEYAKLIPANRLLLETDFPPGDLAVAPGVAAEMVCEALRDAADALAAARGDTREGIVRLTTENALALIM